MRNVVNVLIAALRDAELACDVSLEREKKFARSIVVHQGFGFLSIALPRLGAFLEEGLERGSLPDFPQSMRVFGKSGKGPDFLRELFRMVFDTHGVLRDNASKDAIVWIRQLSYLYKKVKKECTPKREYRSTRLFVATDFQVASTIDQYDQSYVHCFEAVSRVLCSTVFADLDKAVENRQFIPKHGPGAVADGYLPNERYSINYWHDRLETYFPAADFLVPNYNMWLGYEKSVRMIPEDDEQPVRVVFVPKTQKTPRVIAIEPAAMQYCQQALQREYRDALTRHPVTSSVFNWEDQTVNKRAAQQSSRDRSLTTIDLSEASDRVSCCLVELMHKSTPNLLGAMLCTRSKKATLPNGLTIPLRKFASMGSAMCFPVEAMVFYTIVLTAIAFGAKPCVASLQDAMKRLVSRCDGRLTTSFEEISRSILVYGDDIIVPREHTEVVYEWLKAFGLKVNTSKSFHRGLFRESCGGDYYDGSDVSPVYCRSIEPPSRRNASALASWVALRNQCYKRGYWRLTAAIDLLLRMYYGEVPHQPDDSPGIYLCSYRNWSEQGRWNRALQKQRRRVIQIAAVLRQDCLNLPGFLMKFFLGSVDRVSDFLAPRPPSRTDVSERRGSVRIKNRWM